MDAPHLLVWGCLLQVEGEEARIDVRGEAGTHADGSEVDGTVTHHHATPAARHLQHPHREAAKVKHTTEPLVKSTHSTSLTSLISPSFTSYIVLQIESDMQ